MSQLDSMREKILRLVRDHDGQLSWYQLDRALAFGENLPHLHRLGELLDQLTAEGMLRSEGDGPRPRYWITDAGRKMVAQAA